MSVLPFTPRLPPLPYQQRYLDEHGLDPAWGLLWAAGTGKTKATIDNAALLLHHDRIDGMLVLAPNGVHRVWALDELPKHWPHDARLPYEAFEWDTGKAANKGYARDWVAFLARTTPGSGQQAFGVLCMSYDAIMTDAGRQGSWDFLRKRRCIFMSDESQKFKTPSSKRNVRVYAASAYAPYRRIASATPMDSPFDVYSQIKWLDPDFWRRTMGIASFSAFKAHLGNWHKVKLNTGVTFEALNEKNPYRNLDELRAVLATTTTRLTEEQADLALPAATYRRVYHALTPEQERAYEELKTEALTVLASGQLVTAEVALTLRLRLMQIGCGFLNPAAGEAAVPFSGNPRAAAVAEVLQSLGPAEPTLCWGLYIHDCVTLAAASRAAGRRPVIYSADNPETTLDAWKAGDADDLIGNLGSGLVEGHTLVRAAHCLFYSNTPSSIKRYQAERRILRIGQTRPVTYYDFLARGTNDTANLEAVRQKAAWTGQALGDDPARAAAWLRASLLNKPSLDTSIDSSPPQTEEAYPSCTAEEYEAVFRSDP